MEFTLEHLLYFLGAFLLAILSTYLVIWWSHKKSLFIDDENSDKPQGFHNTATPRIGGLGIFLVFILAAVLYPQFLPFLIVTIPAYISGVLEDYSSKISPKIRLVFMIITSVLAIWLMDAVVTDFGFFSVSYSLGVLITLVAIVGLTNGINFIDGYNGLAAITILTIFGTFLAFTITVHDIEYTLLVLLVSLGILGFLFFNYPGGRIFLGDGGAYFLGAFLAILSIVLYNRHCEVVSPWFFLTVLIYPVWEVIFSFFRKIFIQKKSPLQPDRFHFHMLTYRCLAFNKNSWVILFILPILITGDILAYIYRQNSVALMLISLSFILYYTITYNFLRSRDFANATKKKWITEALRGKLSPKVTN